MIRRHVGHQCYLIPQHDHAELSAQLAGHIGHANWRLPEDCEKTLQAIAMHDCGWPIHDERPTLNDQRLPLDVFDPSHGRVIPFWSAGADRASEIDPYVGLLVSLHVFSLSKFLIPQMQGVDPESLAIKFAVNKFHHREIERQEQLRTQLGMRTDLPLDYGLAEPGRDAREDRLRYDFRLLQAMDTLSLALCCTEPPADHTQEVYPRLGDPAVRLRINRNARGVLHVDPWPFVHRELHLSIPYRALPDCTFKSDADLRAAYQSAKVEILPLLVQAP